LSLSPSQIPPIRMAVIGGGITGLAAAHRTIELCQDQQRPLTLTLFEGQSRLGGIFGSEWKGDYLIERGADSFITNKPSGINLCRRLGLEDEFITTNPHFRRSLILSRGRLIPTPDGFNLIAPARIWPMLTTPLLSWSGKFRLLKERFIPRKRGLGDESLAAFVRRRLGNEMLERVVQPMVGGIYTSDPERLSLLATLPRFLEMEQTYGSLLRGMKRQPTAAQDQLHSKAASGARYGLFVSLRNGMQQLLDTLEQRIVAQTRKRMGPRVKMLRRLETGWEVTPEHGASQVFDGVILAVPVHVASALLATVDSELSRLLGGIESASSAIVITGHDLSRIRHPMDAFGVVIPHCEGRRILATSFLSRKFSGRAPAGKIILRTFVGGAMQPEELQQDDDRLLQSVLRELGDIFGIEGSPEFSEVARYPQGMPQYTVGHLDRVREIDAQAQSYPTLKLAGNYFRGVGVPDCIQSGEQAAESLLASLLQQAEPTF